MAADQDKRPFAIQLEVEFLDRLSEPVREGRAKSVSEIIRTALERYDFTNVVVVRPAQLMISVRLPAEIRAALKRTARAKHTSVGQLVRTAVESYLPQLEAGDSAQLEMPIPHVELPEPEMAPEPPAGEPAPKPATPAKSKRIRPAARKKSRPQKSPRPKATPAGAPAKSSAKSAKKIPPRPPKPRAKRK